ncbi:hypothetical protein GGR57DRAFT_506724 [Xylariaceae sp. FL1272]|nr:hypothetical protein GGR57DRAFT_506724 [Xylariaceae sp. FL1272]
MHFPTQISTLLTIASMSGFATAVEIGYGQQIQNGDQTNHWVMWTEGQHACPGMTVIGPITQAACGQTFSVAGETFTFAGCTGTVEPASLLDSSGTTVGFCHRESDKITCHDGLHDIVKHGVCGN